MLVTLIYGSEGGSQRVAGAHAAHHAPILGAALGAEEDILQDVAHYSEARKISNEGRNKYTPQPADPSIVCLAATPGEMNDSGE